MKMLFILKLMSNLKSVKTKILFLGNTLKSF